MTPALTNLTAVVAGVLLAGLVGGQEPPVRPTPPDPGALETAVSEIGVLLAKKAERTAVQRKIGSRLLDAVQSRRGQAASGDAAMTRCARTEAATVLSVSEKWYPLAIGARPCVRVTLKGFRPDAARSALETP